jgi:hypothetical protein
LGGGGNLREIKAISLRFFGWASTRDQADKANGHKSLEQKSTLHREDERIE